MKDPNPIDPESKKLFDQLILVAKDTYTNAAVGLVRAQRVSDYTEVDLLCIISKDEADGSVIINPIAEMIPLDTAVDRYRQPDNKTGGFMPTDKELADAKAAMPPKVIKARAPRKPRARKATK